MSLDKKMGWPVLACLDMLAPTTAAIRSVVNQGALRVLDSPMIIDAMPEPIEAERETLNAVELRHSHLAYMDDTLEKIRTEGLSLWYKEFMRGFIRIMFENFFDENQYARACKHIETGLPFMFLMSDAGGPSMGQWRTSILREGPPYRFAIDKVWGMEAHRQGFALVVGRGKSAFVPTAFIVWPEQYAKLKREAFGEPFLGGAFQLGNVRGEADIDPTDILKTGGTVAVNKQLTTVRPFLVRALMEHVRWLASSGRATLDARLGEAVDYLAVAARRQTDTTSYSGLSVQRVLALKFASNEVLHALVSQGAVRSAPDQRDLLAFTKMEGSSYRCYQELLSAFKRRIAKDGAQNVKPLLQAGM